MAPTAQEWKWAVNLPNLIPSTTPGNYSMDVMWSAGVDRMYVVWTDLGDDSQHVTLIDVSWPPSALDTVSASVFDYGPVWTNRQGTLALWDAPTNATVVYANDGSVISTASFTMDAAMDPVPSYQCVTPDGDELIGLSQDLGDTWTVWGCSAVDGSLVWSGDFARPTVDWGNFSLVGSMGAGTALVYAIESGTTGHLCLVDATGIIDTLDTTSGLVADLVAIKYWYSLGANAIAYVVVSATDITYRAVTLSGATLSWVDTEQVIATDWTTATGGDADAWDGQVFAIPFMPYVDGFPTETSAYWIDPLTATYATKAGSMEGDDTAPTLPIATGTAASIIYNGITALSYPINRWEQIAAVVAPLRYLRQRQSPRSYPTRVNLVR